MVRGCEGNIKEHGEEVDYANVEFLACSDCDCTYGGDDCKEARASYNLKVVNRGD